MMRSDPFISASQFTIVSAELLGSSGKRRSLLSHQVQLPAAVCVCVAM